MGNSRRGKSTQEIAGINTELCVSEKLSRKLATITFLLRRYVLNNYIMSDIKISEI